MREQSIMLKHHVRFAYIRRLVIHQGTTDTNLTALGGFQSTNEPQCSGLAASTGPEQSKELASVDRQTQIVYRHGSMKTLGDVDEFDTGRPRHTSASLPYTQRRATRVPRIATSKGTTTSRVPSALTIGETPRRIME
jgi:hypothetical protein